jgi:hypothetical protein
VLHDVLAGALAVLHDVLAGALAVLHDVLAGALAVLHDVLAGALAVLYDGWDCCAGLGCAVGWLVDWAVLLCFRVPLCWQSESDQSRGSPLLLLSVSAGHSRVA